MASAPMSTNTPCFSLSVVGATTVLPLAAEEDAAAVPPVPAVVVPVDPPVVLPVPAAVVPTWSDGCWGTWSDDDDEDSPGCCW